MKRPVTFAKDMQKQLEVFRNVRRLPLDSNLVAGMLAGPDMPVPRHGPVDVYDITRDMLHGGPDKRPVLRPGTLLPRGWVFVGARQGLDPASGLANVSGVKTGPSRREDGRSAPIAFNGGWESGEFPSAVDAAVTRYQVREGGPSVTEAAEVGSAGWLLFVYKYGNRRGSRSRQELRVRVVAGRRAVSTEGRTSTTDGSNRIGSESLDALG